MSNGNTPPPRREPSAGEPTALQRAIAALEKMKARLDEAERAANEPLAVVGMDCRFPGGGEGLQSFWRTLDSGIDAVREIPAERWPKDAIPGDRSEVRWAALLDDVTMFDAAFFGISPREAETMDPQQRMLLEVTWGALEDAGARPDALNGSRAGVFVGMCGNDYQHIVARAKAGHYDMYCATGTAANVAAGRIAFALGLQGPAITMDTACSSSLVAVAQACQSLRSRDCDVAIAGGVQATISPVIMAMLAETQAMSPDGRCKALDARANGFVRGEGCGILVLKRFSDALRDGDRIRAVIRGWAVNQDGRSTGLTAPNVLSQQAMLRQALARARLQPSDIGYVEMHGTGTPLGDPIEAEALREVLGAPRADSSSCVLGAVKTNIGHLEGAAGVAGLVKVVLSMEHERIPGNLHFRRLNPRIDFSGTPFVIPTASVPWPRGEKVRRAGVSAFGISGTNAHVILEEAPAPLLQPAKEAPAYLLPLSAKSPEALSALAKSYAEHLTKTTNVSLHDVAYTASVRRMHHEHRLAVAGRTREEIVELLASFARGDMPSGALCGKSVQQARPRVVFVFSGQGSQWAAMGKQLLADVPVCRAKLEEIDALARPYAGFSIIEELTASEERSRLGETEVVQPALFALQVALAELLKSWGLPVGAVIGHSVGEIAAAYVAGALSLEDAVRLVVLRGRIMQKATGGGKMAWVSLSFEDALRAIEGREDVLSVGAKNDPRSVVLSGPMDVLDAVLSNLAARGVVVRPLRVNYAFHSPQMEPLARELADALGALGARRTSISMFSTVTGARIGGEVLDASYWRRNVRETVDFSGAVAAALAEGLDTFVEVGPHPVLLANLEQCIAAAGVAATAVGTQRRHGEALYELLRAVGALSVRGAPIDWAKLYPEGGRVVVLPAYPWQRQRYWIEEAPSMPAAGFVPVRSPSSQRTEGESPHALRGQLQAAAPPRRLEILASFVAELARRALGFKGEQESLPRDVSFSQLGMDSLMAMEISRGIRQATGIEISSVSLFRYPTVSALSDHLNELLSATAAVALEGDRSAKTVDDVFEGRLVVFREAGTLSPLFLVHPIEGSAFSFSRLAQYSNVDRPIYAFHARGIETDEPPVSTIEEIAASYVALMRKIQPEGPYHIVGYSFGGIVAFEMARRLTQAGERVSEVILIDTAAPLAPEKREHTLALVARFVGLSLDAAAMEGQPAAVQVRAVAEAMARSVAINATTEDGKRRLRVLEAHLKALAVYAPTSSMIPVRLIRAATPMDSGALAALEEATSKGYGWERWTTLPLVIEEVVGTHHGMIEEPCVADLARAIERLVEQDHSRYRNER